MVCFLIEKKISQIKKKLHNSSDIGTRILLHNNQKIGLIYLKSMTDEVLFTKGICDPFESYQGEINLDSVEKEIIKCADIEKVSKDRVLEKILRGGVAIILEGETEYICVDIQQFPMRAPSEPPTSAVIRGPREGFTEDIKTNVTLLRRRFYSESLVLKDMVIGKYSQTKVTIAYLDGVADLNLVKKVEKQLKNVKIDGIIDSYYVLNLLERKPSSLFKQIGVAEKPDIVSAKLLEGRIAIIVDGSPMVLTLPFLLVEDLQSSNDYYTNNYYASFIRVVRLIGVLLAVVVPGVYLALRLFHYNVLPLKFLITVADTTQGIPFTPFIELLFIFLLFQILYEVSLRLPSYLGLATSIVGALILGDTGVKAGLISPPGVIVIALAKIAVYTIPEQAPQLTILQIIFLFLGGMLGLLGIAVGLIYVFSDMNKIDSYGSPYLAPYSPRVPSDLKDGLFKYPLRNMRTRPKSIKNKNKKRQK